MHVFMNMGLDLPVIGVASLPDGFDVDEKRVVSWRFPVETKRGGGGFRGRVVS